MGGNTGSDQELEAQVLKQINAEVKTSVVEIYEDLLRTVWAKIVPTLGTVTVVTIMQRAINRTVVKHPVLENITVGDSGFSFAGIQANIIDQEKEELKNSFKDLIANLFDILAKLTGNILVQQLMKEVEGLEIQ